MLIASLVIAAQKPDPEKLSPYECGFEPFEDARGRFDVRSISSRFFSSFLTSKWPFFFRGPLRLATSECSVFGQ